MTLLSRKKDVNIFLLFSFFNYLCTNFSFYNFLALNAWLRWNFLSGGNGNNSGNNASGNNGNVGKGSGLGSIVRFHRRKMQKRLVHKVQVEELEAVRKAYQVSQQVQVCSTYLLYSLLTKVINKYVCNLS